MAFIPVPDTAEVVMTYTLSGGAQVKNVYNVREASILTWDTTQLNALVDEFVAWETDEARAIRSNGCTLTTVTARDLTEADSFVVERAVSVAGQVVSPLMPANVTFCVKSTTGLAGRTHRGRTYWVGLAEGQVTNDFVVSTTRDAIRDALNALGTALQALGWALVVVSRQIDNLPRTTGLATDITEWLYIDSRVDTQRRRLLGEGT